MVSTSHGKARDIIMKKRKYFHGLQYVYPLLT